MRLVENTCAQRLAAAVRCGVVRGGVVLAGEKHVPTRHSELTARACVLGRSPTHDVLETGQGVPRRSHLLYEYINTAHAPS